MLPEPTEYIEFLAPYSEKIQILARNLRRRLLEILPPCIETVWDGSYTVVVVFGFTEKSGDHFLHLPAYTNHVNLGFAQGALINDPKNRLKGTGSKVRHISLTSVEDLEDVVVLDLIRQAYENAVRPLEPVESKTIIRTMNGPKRRPRPSNLD